MRKPYSILIILILISCQEKDWKTNLLNEIAEFETSEKIDKKYSIKHNTGNDILIEQFKTHSNGLTKLTAEYTRPELGSWEKLFFLKNSKLLYSRNFGIAPVQNLENDTINRPKYFLIERRVWFENDSIGKEEIKELEMFDLKNIESKKAELLKMEFITFDLNISDYKLFVSDFKALTE
ncbi:hypothetical protein [uncultured Nonlabens sp.]|uniref:hypothetical protein n=1 Tax=uncultured Nonlabens sp. TaxID=859306 RepID=UPI0030D6F1A0|tara:strand:+ start:559 stop:1095 length:537 start_codon:yes stop_codon:yes gene_type:complete